VKAVAVGNFQNRPGHPLTLIGGPCAIESLDMSLHVGKAIKEICASLGVNYIFKSSYDKANRSSDRGFRGVGLADGLDILGTVRDQLGVPVLTDVHDSHDVEQVASVVDVLQIPAFLCRQTDLLVAAARSGKVVNVKKGQFLAPWDMRQVVNKLETAGAAGILVTERGVSFGYNALVVDFRSLPQLRDLGYPVVFDGTHSVQMPGAKGESSGGQRQFVPPLSRAAAAVGIDALFWEIHEHPDSAPSDGPNMVPLDQLEGLLRDVLTIHQARTALEPVQLRGSDA
jgi:2-dehydro-3-deoxyphosphooctonate aldolase (KDO 8-P synthase)